MYVLRIQVEHKSGKQVPRTFRRFVDTTWFRAAMQQAQDAIRTDEDARPAVMIDGRWVVVDAALR